MFFTVSNEDVREVPADVLLLKHAQGFHGADKAVVARLTGTGKMSEADLRVSEGEFVLIATRKAIAAKRVMFLGVPPLPKFNYDEMQHFAMESIRQLAADFEHIGRLATTIHGYGYGLDGEESLQRMMQGFRDGLANYPNIRIDEIVFVEIDKRRSQILSAALNSSDTTMLISCPRPRGSARDVRTKPLSSDITVRAEPKRHVFVAMPFSEEFEDIYQYGIHAPVRACGFICEKTSESAFAGDILQRIKDRIQTANYVVAELTGARPNVYLEVGYAWGKGIPVIFLAKYGEQLHFDVTRHRCIYYKSIRHLAEELEKLLRGLETSGPS